MCVLHIGPICVTEPNLDSESTSDRLHLAICRGRISTAKRILDSDWTSVDDLTNRAGMSPLFCAAFFGHEELVKILIQKGADPNRYCPIELCTPVHAACWSGDHNIIKSLVIAGGDLHFRDRQGRTPRDWAKMQIDSKVKSATLALIESFHHIAKNGNQKDVYDMGASAARGGSAVQHTFLDLKRNSLAASRNEVSNYMEPCTDILGTGFGKMFYGKGESAAALWSVPLVNESEVLHLNSNVISVLLPSGIDYRSGPTTEMVGRHWGQSPVTLRRMRGNEPPDLLLEELSNMRRLRHSNLLLLMGVSTAQNYESVQLIYEPVYQGSLYHHIHMVGISIPLLQKIEILQQICEAVLFLHSKKMLHCSISSHAVHLVSLSQAKLGCFETLTEIDPLNPNCRRMYRKVPPEHWEWITSWMSPEATRGESLCPLTDVYSFCCVVWETLCEEKPWFYLDAIEIREMWTRQAAMRGSGRPLDSMLPLDTPCIPLKINRFLLLGLQPELKDRRDIDCQEIYFMLRIQASAIQKSQQKIEMHQQKSTSSLETIVKSSQTYSPRPHRSPPQPASRVTHLIDNTGSKPSEKSSLQLTSDAGLSVRQLRNHYEGKEKAKPTKIIDYSRSNNEVQSRQCPVIAIKPVGHCTEVGVYDPSIYLSPYQSFKQADIEKGDHSHSS